MERLVDVFGCDDSGSPEAGLAVRKPEPLRHHADDRARLIIEVDAASDRIPVSSKTFLPKGIADEDYLVVHVQTVVGLQFPAKHRMCAEKAKEIHRNLLPADPLEKISIVDCRPIITINRKTG